MRNELLKSVSGLPTEPDCGALEPMDGMMSLYNEKKSSKAILKAIKRDLTWQFPVENGKPVKEATVVDTKYNATKKEFTIKLRLDYGK